MKKITPLFLMCFCVTTLFCESYEDFVKLIQDKNEIEQIIWIDKQLSHENDIRYYILKANIEIKMGDYRSAKNTLLTAQQVGTDENLQRLLGIVYFLLKDYDNASSTFCQVLEKNPDDQLAKTYMCMLSPLDDGKKAVAKKSGISIEDECAKLEPVDYEQLVTLYNEELGECGDDYVYLLNEQIVEVASENSYNYIAHYVIKVNSSTAVSLFRDFSYSYNGYEFAANVLKAGTYLSDGSFASVDKKHIVDIDNQKKSSSAMYSNRKTIVFPFPDIQEGSVIEVAIKFVSTGKSLSPKIYEEFGLSSAVHALMYRYTLQYPKNVSLNIFKKGDDIVENTIATDPVVIKKFIYNETIENYGMNNKIVFTCYKDWNEVTAWYNDIFYKMLSKEDNSIADKIIASLSLNGKSKMEQIEAVYKYIKKNIRYVGMELEENAMLPRTPSEIYKNKYGDCKDQVVFMMYLLRRLNIDCNFALLATGVNGVDQDIPSPLYFNHVINYIPVQNGVEKELFIDTTSFKLGIGNLPSMDQGVMSMVIFNENSYKFIETPIIPPESNAIYEHFVAEVNEIGSGRVTYDEKFTGAYADILSESFADKNYDYVIDFMLKNQKETYHNLQKENISVSGLDPESDEIVVNLWTDEKNIVSLFFDGKMKLKFTLSEILSVIGVPTDVNRDYNRGFLSSFHRTLEYKLPPNYTITEGSVKNIYKQNEYISLEFQVDKKDVNTYVFTVDFIANKRDIPQKFVAATQKLIAEFVALTNLELTFENKVDFDNEAFFDKLIEEYAYKDVYEKYIAYLSNQGKFDKALEICDKASSTFNENSYFGLLKASLLFQMERYEEDEVLLNDLLNVAFGKGNKEDMLDIYYYMLSLYKRTCADDKFESTLIDALSHFYDDRALVGEATSFYCRTQQYEKAIALLNEAIISDRNNSSYYTDLGYVYSMVPDFEHAEEALLNAIKFDKNNHNAMNNLAWLYGENNKKLDEALNLAKRAVELEPLNDSYLDTLGEIYYLVGDYEKAKQTIKKALQINPNTYLQHQLEKVENAEKENSNE